jgi:hypothetical protein
MGGHVGLSASLNLDYAENGRKKLMGGYSQINLEPEEPRNIAESDKRSNTIAHTGAERYCHLRCLAQEVV